MPACARNLSYVKGIHNMKAGAVYQQTFLDENDRLGIVDPTFLPSLSDANGTPCYDRTTHQAIDSPCTDLIPYDLTQPGGGSLYAFKGHTDVKELALYVEDNITKGALGVQSRIARRSLQWPFHTSGRRTASGRRLQHQKDQHRSSGFLCACARNSLQRKSDAFQRGVQ